MKKIILLIVFFGIRSHVAVEIYTLSDSKLTTLFDSDIDAGILYKADFNTTNLPEGVYLYKVIAVDRVFNGQLIKIDKQ